MVSGRVAWPTGRDGGRASAGFGSRDGNEVSARLGCRDSGEVSTGLGGRDDCRFSLLHPHV